MTYSDAFQKAVALILRHEGGYVDRPDDPGGETNFGISKRSYPHEDIRNLTREQATEIYHRDFWQAIRGDELPAPLALVTFDMAANAGTGAAVKLLQRTLKVPDDGKLGPQTITAARALRDPVDAATRLSRRRILYYASLGGWKVEDFRNAWTQRTLETLLVAAA